VVKEFYGLREFCLPVSPLVLTDTKQGRRMARTFDRTLTFSQSTLQFLLANKLNIQDVFTKGVPYLSRKEADVVSDFLGKLTADKIDESTLDVGDRLYFKDLRQKLSSWLDSKLTVSLHHIPVKIFASDNLQASPYLVLDPCGGILRTSSVRMICQIIHEEFPQCECSRAKDGTAMMVRVDPTARSASEVSRTL
jgi:hypothetical protein